MSIMIAIFAFAPGLVVLVATVVKLHEVRAAKRYRTARGRVVTSKVESRPGRGMNDKPTYENFAKIVYEYEVNGRKWRAERVSIGEEKGNVGVESTLEKYPRGKEITVFHDPLQPGKAVLERDLPAGFVQGMLVAIGFFFGGPLFLMFAFTEMPQRIASLLPRPENATLVTLLAFVSLFLIAMSGALWQEHRRERKLVATPGRIVESAVVPYETIFLKRLKTMYRAHVVYEYSAKGRTYRGSNLTSNVDISRGSARAWDSLLAKYPVGREVTVYHDPIEPSISVLERPWGVPVFILALGVVAIAATIRLAV